jgi:hypothetical protein
MMLTGGRAAWTSKPSKTNASTIAQVRVRGVNEVMGIQAIVVRRQASHRTDDANSSMERPRLPRNKPASSRRNGYCQGDKTSTAVNPT